MLEQDLLLDLYSENKSWRKVAERIGRFSDTYWLLLAKGKRKWKVEHRNLVRQVFDLPPLERPPLERIAEEHIERVFKLSEEPDAAALFSIGDRSLLSANFKVFPAGYGNDPSGEATACSITTVKRRDRQPVFPLSFSNLDAESPETMKRKTGNLPKISSAVQRARAAFDYVPDAAEVAAFMAALADGYENQMEVM